MKVLIDNAHGRETTGRVSPDRSFFEWKWCREIAIGIVRELELKGYDAERIVLEDDYDVPPKIRVMRVNKICGEEGKDNVLLVSIWCNKAGSSKKDDWRFSRGIDIRLGHNPSEGSLALAKLLRKETAIYGYLGDRRCPYTRCTASLVNDSLCPSVITKNLFIDNKEDLVTLKSDEGKQDIVKMHVNAIEEYIKRYGK